jgi:hypothetical protein
MMYIAAAAFAVFEDRQASLAPATSSNLVPVQKKEVHLKSQQARLKSTHVLQQQPETFDERKR